MDTTEKETIVAEVKSPVPSQETVEAAKQILTDVLEKAVDAIKETSLLSSSTSTAEATKDEAKSDKTFRFGSSLGKFALDETIADYVVECLCDGKQALVGEGSTFVGNPMAAKGFRSYADAQDFIEEKESKTIVLEEPRILMRETRCKLSEVGYGE